MKQLDCFGRLHMAPSSPHPASSTHSQAELPSREEAMAQLLAERPTPKTMEEAMAEAVELTRLLQAMQGNTTEEEEPAGLYVSGDIVVMPSRRCHPPHKGLQAPPPPPWCFPSWGRACASIARAVFAHALRQHGWMIPWICPPQGPMSACQPKQ
eukprot:s6222_g5.t1